MPKKLFGLYTV